MERFIIIDRQEFTLTLFESARDLFRRKLTSASRFRVAVGKPGDETPAGTFTVVGKSARPDWEIPEHPDYAPETWGQVIPFGTPGCPFAVGFISLGDGVGIHATTFPPMIGNAASHGCIRMRKRDMRRIYDRVPVGTRVWIL